MRTEHRESPRSGPVAALVGPEIRLALTPAGVASALAWVAGGAAAGSQTLRWWDLARLFLGCLLIGTVWVRLVGYGAGADRSSPTNPPSLRRASSARSFPYLPYTRPGSLSALAARALGKAFRKVQTALAKRTTPEFAFLLVTLLLTCALLGNRPLVACAAGLALLGLLRLARSRTWPRLLLAGISLIAWPWWLGHACRAPLSIPSLCLGLLWGTAAGAWLALLRQDAPRKAAMGFLFPQATGVLWILLSRPSWGTFLAFALLGQSLPLLRAPSNPLPVPSLRAVSLWAAASLVSSGIALGGWFH